MNDSKTTFLSLLLPYALEGRTHGKIRIGLNEYRLLLIALLAANEAFLNMDLEKFDSLVGENACQIRAVWISILASRKPVNLDSLNKRIDSIVSKIDALLEPKSIDLLMRSELSLKAILDQESLELSLTAQEMFIIQSYLLTEMKMDSDSKKSMKSICKYHNAAPKKLLKFGNVSIAFADNLLSRLRKKLASASVEFVREYASPSQRLMVSPQFTIEHNAMPCIPMFWTYKTVLSAAQAEKIPLIIHVKFLQKNPNGFSVLDEEVVFFNTAPNGAYVPSQPNESDLDKPACVIQGIAASNEKGQILSKSQWKASIEEKGVIDVILAGAADHRQFPNPDLDDLLSEHIDHDFLGYKALAKDHGFSFENPTTFFIQHVYACRVGKIIEEVTTRPVSKESNTSILKRLQEMMPFNTLNCSHRTNFIAVCQ